MKTNTIPEGLPTNRFPVDPWKLVERQYSDADLGHTETLFAIANGYIGMRGNFEEGRNTHSHGTYINGLHETWEIVHAEPAYGFAKTGQTIVNVPDGKLMKLYVDDEPLLLATADLERYERSVDFKTGILTRDLIWRTPSGKRVHVKSERMASLVHRHLAVLTMEVTVLDGSAPLVISSQLLNRQDGEDEYHVEAAALGEGIDPRKGQKISRRVLEPRTQKHDGTEATLGYRCANSRMTVACGYRHAIDTELETEIDTQISADVAKTVIRAKGVANQPIKITKLVGYHSSTGVPAQELTERCSRTLAYAEAEGLEKLQAEQQEFFADFWKKSDIQVTGDDRIQQALRWNIFQLAQASICTQEQGIAAKGLTSNGYEGHYFWDTEIYVIPFLSYTNPTAARRLLRFRWHMLPAARRRAKELNHVGALYPWRTTNGEEASAYYAAGTAQYHINAAVVYALRRYVEASGDQEFLEKEGAEILLETSRLWHDLGFYSGADKSFHIHRVTGPDEYTAVVNNNAYTNIMAQYCLQYSADTLRALEKRNPERFAELVLTLGLETEELDAWEKAAKAMYIPYNEELGINPQDDAFLSSEPWDWENTPVEKYPLLRNYHPLVIYRHQVLKQADVVLAMYLVSQNYSKEQIARNFEYYDPITTGDSSLSPCIQSLVASRIGKGKKSTNLLKEALYLDLCNTHANTDDGAHIASCGGVWAIFVHGFAGMVEHGDMIEFSPNLPADWSDVSFSITRHDAVLQIVLSQGSCNVTVVEGSPVPLLVDGKKQLLSQGNSLSIG